MNIQQFETKIQQEIDPNLNIRVNPNHDDIAGVYWKDAYISVAVPSGEIKEEFDKKYVDAQGYPYRTIEMAEELIKAKMQKFIDNYDLMTQDV